MKKSTLAIIVSIFSLTACGGGGGGSHHTSSQKSLERTVNSSIKSGNSSSTAQKSGQSNIENPQEKPDTIHGNYLVGASRKNVGYASFSLSGKELDHIQLFGRKIPLSDPASKPVDGWNHIGNGLVSSEEQLTYSRHGAFQHGSEIYIFAQGEKAQSVPNTGKFTYEGTATIITVEGKDVFKELKEGETKLLVTPTTSKFEADFDKKSLLGSISVGSGRNILLQADINGSTFRKSAGSNDYKVTGEFYGKNGEELAGTYSLHQKVSGTFGAKRVDKKAENQPQKP